MTGVWYLLALISLGAASEWGYLEHGPSTWGHAYPGCTGKSQSPIDIQVDDTVYDGDLVPFVFKGYDSVPAGASYTLINNGHSAQVNIKADDKDAFSVSGGGLPNTYIADQFHFHWGSDDNKGSEHTVDGRRYPMEMHIVHHSSDYSDIGQAKDKPKGLAVLGFLFKIGAENPKFIELVDNLPNVVIPDLDSPLTPFALRNLLPADLKSYWRYSGSLTTPTCDESVIWTIFQDPIEISEEQLKKFRELYYDGNFEESVVNNFRPTQSLNGRTVYTSSVVDSVLRLLRYLLN